MTWVALVGATLVVAYYAVQVATFEGPRRVLAEWLAADVLLRCVLAVGITGLLLAIVGLAGQRARISPLAIAAIVAGASVLPWREMAFINERGGVEVDAEDRWNLGYLTCVVCALVSVNLFLS